MAQALSSPSVSAQIQYQYSSVVCPAPLVWILGPSLTFSMCCLPQLLQSLMDSHPHLSCIPHLQVPPLTCLVPWPRPEALHTRPTRVSISYLQLHADASFPQTVRLQKRAWAPPPRAFGGFPTAPPPHVQAPHWLRRPRACPLPLPPSNHPHFSRGIPLDEAPHALPT